MALTDSKDPSTEVPRLVWRRDVRLGVNHELHTVCLPFASRDYTSSNIYRAVAAPKDLATPSVSLFPLFILYRATTYL